MTKGSLTNSTVRLDSLWFVSWPAKWKIQQKFAEDVLFDSFYDPWRGMATENLIV